ncbi:MAG: P22 phage major capsid protein family protein [Oscillospiraceae bacterium]
MVNLNTKFHDGITSKFAQESLVANRLSSDYEFSGAKTVKVLTPITVAMQDYTRSGSNRYGTPTEMQDIVQELTLSQDKSFTITIDKGNLEDQNYAKNTMTMVAVQMRERAIPEMDKYVLNMLAKKAGKIVGQTAETTTGNVCARISDATKYLDDNEVPVNDRTLFVSADTYRLLKHSNEYMAVEGLAREAIRRGTVGRYDAMEVVKVPASRWPLNANFIIVHKNAAVAPVKLSETKVHQDPPGISGALLEGRQYYDLFVFGARCDGVYADVDVRTGKGIVCAKPAIAANGALSCATAGAVIHFTTDGTDPRFSTTAKTGTVSDMSAVGTKVRAYAELEGGYPSEVETKTL